jgi:TetR/AcrR family transcriptional regulator, transcriptional repressor for nem operon
MIILLYAAMPRTRSYTSEDLLQSALLQFWSCGFNATSMDDLVRVTGVSRHGIYGEFGDKRVLYLACFDHYRIKIVDPAFCRVEDPGAGLAEITQYFEHQISLAEREGLPGPGCFVANATTETAPHDRVVRRLVQAHNTRLHNGFSNALASSASGLRSKSKQTTADMAQALVTFAAGLWTMSRITEDAAALRTATAKFLNLIEEGL